MPLPTHASVGKTAATAANPATSALVAEVAASATSGGAFELLVTTWQAGTADSNAANMKLQLNDGTTQTLIMELPSSSTPITTYVPFVDLGESEDIEVIVGATATGASAVYCASIVATRLS